MTERGSYPEETPAGRPALTFRVLGQIAPLLAWSEGDTGSRLPDAWSTEAVPIKRRERAWLSRELPTYSYDNVEDIVAGSRQRHRAVEPATLPADGSIGRSPSLSPPPRYDLIQAFRELNDHFFVWNGTEPCIREHRMEELHELALRLPAGHIVRHGHARAVSERVLSFEQAVELPELVTLLPSNSFGLRSVVRKGLSESHLHLNGVTSTEETWADNLLRPLTAAGIRHGSAAERRLLILNLFAGRILALAVWWSLDEVGEMRKRVAVHPQRLLQLLDDIYFARDSYLLWNAGLRMENEIHRALYGDHKDLSTTGAAEDSGTGLISVDLGEDYRFLLRWMAPAAFRSERQASQQLSLEERLPSSVPERIEDRCRFVHRLHLAGSLRLVQLSAPAVDLRQEAQRHRQGQPTRSVAPDPRRHFLHEALFRYIVCRTHHWQLATQQSRTTGLRHFKQYFSSPHRRPSAIGHIQYSELVLRRLRQWRGLRVLEGRVGPPSKVHDLVPWILAFARAPDRRLEKFGLVVHFKKQDEGSEERGLSIRSGPPLPRLRWGKRRRHLRDEGQSLFRILQAPTPITPFVVGIDAASLELATPPEVFAPVFRFLRELPIPIAERSQRFASYQELDPAIRRLAERRRLGMTYHVGEDFRHLLSGLRAIFEVVEFLRPQPGDRLGHGTALALQPRIWLEQCGYQAVMPKLEWLDTLVWVHHFLGPGDDVVGRLGIEDRIQRHAWEIYSEAIGGVYDPLAVDVSRGKSGPESGTEAGSPRRRGLLDWDWSPLTLWDAWTLRQLDPYSLDLGDLFLGELKLRPASVACAENRRWYQIQERAVHDVQQEIGSRNAYLLLALYWMSPSVREQGDKPVVVDMLEDRDSWLEICRRVEERMKTLIHRRELVVEVNPSANRIIGPMERYEQHHVFALTLNENRRLDRQVRVSINTDNPAVCNTTLAHEYYLLGEILMEQGVPEAEVVEWLEWLRKNGEEYNFARRLPNIDKDPDMEGVISWMQRLLPTVWEGNTREEKQNAFWTWYQTTHLLDAGFSLQQVNGNREVLDRLLAIERKAQE